MNRAESIQRELAEAQTSLFSKENDSALRVAIHSEFPSLEYGLILSWIPEQAEDICYLLVDLNRVAKFEIPRLPGLPSVDMEIISLQDYKRFTHSARARRKIETAILMMRDHIFKKN